MQPKTSYKHQKSTTFCGPPVSSDDSIDGRGSSVPEREPGDADPQTVWRLVRGWRKWAEASSARSPELTSLAARTTRRLDGYGPYRGAASYGDSMDRRGAGAGRRLCKVPFLAQESWGSPRFTQVRHVTWNTCHTNPRNLVREQQQQVGGCGDSMEGQRNGSGAQRNGTQTGHDTNTQHNTTTHNTTQHNTNGTQTGHKGAGAGTGAGHAGSTWTRDADRPARPGPRVTDRRRARAPSARAPRTPSSALPAPPCREPRAPSRKSRSATTTSNTWTTARSGGQTLAHARLP